LKTSSTLWINSQENLGVGPGTARRATPGRALAAR